MASGPVMGSKNTTKVSIFSADSDHRRFGDARYGVLESLVDRKIAAFFWLSRRLSSLNERYELKWERDGHFFRHRNLGPPAIDNYGFFRSTVSPNRCRLEDARRAISRA